MAKALLGIDVGGGCVRAVIRELESGKLTAVKKGMDKALFPIGEFGCGMDTAAIYALLAQAVKDCLAKGGYAPGDIAALSACVLRHTLVALDGDGQVLFSSPNRDARAVDAAMRLNDTCADEIYRLSGHRPMPNLTACKLLWLKETQPALYWNIRTAFSLQDYLNYLFTGKITAERSQAGETMLYDLQASSWSDAMIARLGLERTVFPKLVDAGMRLGNLTAEAARALGLSEAAVVVAGAGDTQSALLGMGVTANGETAVAAGAAAPVQMLLDKPVIDPKGRLWTGAAGLPGKYVLESNAGGMGVSLEWIAGLLFGGHPNPCGALMAAASKAGPGAGGMLSTVGAQIFNHSVLRLPIGQTLFSTTNYVPNAAADRNRAARAVVEGMAFVLRGNVEQLEEVSGLQADMLRFGGGMAKDGILAEVTAQATGKPVAVPQYPDLASAMGAVVCAAVGAGICADFAQAAEQFAQLNTPIEIQTDVYERIYGEWTEMVKTSAGSFMQPGALITELRQDSIGAQAQGSAEAVPLRIYTDADLSEDAVKLLGAFGSITAKNYRDGEMLEGGDMAAALKDYDVFITEAGIVGAAIIKELPNLRMIGVCRGNPTNIDIDACSAAGIPVVYTPGCNAEAVADMAVAFILNIARMIPESAAFLKEPGGAGDMGRQGAAHFRYQGTELWRANVGIVGGGAIGKKVAKRLLGFDANLFVYDPYLSNEDAILMGAHKVELDELLAVSDIITLHAPVTPETTNMIDAAAFAKMKDGVLIVNTARAALMDYGALLANLQSGKVKGAALDVFPAEPPAPDDPLMLLPNVLSTPQMAGNTKQVSIHQGLIMAENIQKLLAGEMSSDVINRKAFQGFSFTGEKKFDTAALEQMQDKTVGVNDLDQGRQEARPAAKAPAARAAAHKATGYMVLIEAFLAHLSGNAEVKEKTAGKDISFQITFKDNEESCYIYFNKGEIEAGLGTFPTGAEVNLRMPVEIFDGMMRGTVNGAKAAMTGQMSFTGDMRKATSMQAILNLMMGSYRAAIEQAGPFGIASLAAAPEAEPVGAAILPPEPANAPGQTEAPRLGFFARRRAKQQPVIQQAAAVPQADLGATGHPKTGDIRDELLQIVTEMYRKGLITGIGGNISVRCEDNPNHVWIMPNSIFKGDLAANQMVRIDLEGNTVGGAAELSVSSEKNVHTAIYKKRPDILAVIHSHATKSTLMGLAGLKFTPVSSDAAFFGEVPMVPFMIPGTPELGDLVAEAMGEEKAVCIMQNHGLVVAGTSLRRASDMTDCVEITAAKILEAKAMGVELEVISGKDLEELSALGKMLV